LPQKFADPAGEVCLRKDPTGGDDDEAVQQASRHDLARALAPRYVHASRREGPVLGCRRRHLLQRLAPFLPELLERLRYWHALHHVSAETIQRVVHMSPATSDRALASSRDGLPKRGLSTTRPGTLLNHQVAIKTFADWTETVPGFVEVDLVAHCGWTGAGPFLYTLTLVDVATGGVSCAGLRDKRAQTVLAALRRLQEDLPFRILGLDSDSGREFLNTMLTECVLTHGGRPTAVRLRSRLERLTRSVGCGRWVIIVPSH
jgi:hypothetical protein